MAGEHICGKQYWTGFSPNSSTLIVVHLTACSSDQEILQVFWSGGRQLSGGGGNAFRSRSEVGRIFGSCMVVDPKDGKMDCYMYGVCGEHQTFPDLFLL